MYSATCASPRESFVKGPKFSVLTILGLALGIAVSTALFAFVNWSAVGGRGAGYRPPDDVSNPATYVSLDRQPYLVHFSVPEFAYFQQHSSSLEQITAESEPVSMVLGSSSAEAEEASVRLESPDFLNVRGFHPVLGRTFSEDEDRSGAPVAVLSDAFWRRRFGGDPGILGQSILLNNHAVTLIGVADPRFHSTEIDEVFIPLGLKALQPANLQVILNARLRPPRKLSARPNRNPKPDEILRGSEPGQFPVSRRHAQRALPASLRLPRGPAAPGRPPAQRGYPRSRPGHRDDSPHRLFQPRQPPSRPCHRPPPRTRRPSFARCQPGPAWCPNC